MKKISLPNTIKRPIGDDIIKRFEQKSKILVFDGETSPNIQSHVDEISVGIKFFPSMNS